MNFKNGKQVSVNPDVREILARIVQNCSNISLIEEVSREMLAECHSPDSKIEFLEILCSVTGKPLFFEILEEVKTGHDMRC